MEKQIIEEKVFKIIKENCQFNAEKLNSVSDLRENYGIDSILIVNILVDIECEFDITIDSSLLSYDNFSNITKIVDYVNGALN